jgi:hypothetical protein
MSFDERIISSALKPGCRFIPKKKIEEKKKDLAHPLIVSARPLKSGELECDEELSLEDSFVSRDHHYCTNEEEKQIHMIKTVFGNKP